MADILDFHVWTKPVPQGSFIARQMGAKAYAVPSNNNKLKKYRKLIAAYACSAMQAKYGAVTIFAQDVPIELELTFTFARPASVKASKRPMPIVKPDCDKLIRSIGDALTGVVYQDDAQIVSIIARKEYGTKEGVQIIVRRMYGGGE